jgi:hypothetical protein
MNLLLTNERKDSVGADLSCPNTHQPKEKQKEKTAK